MTNITAFWGNETVPYLDCGAVINYLIAKIYAVQIKSVSTQIILIKLILKLH